MRFLMLLASLVSASASAEIFKCVEEGGRVTYSNVQATGCTRLNVGPTTNQVPKRSGGASPNVRSTLSGDFPRVDTGTQRARDDDRRRILDQELANETSALESARKVLSSEESQVMPEERNVAGRGINNAKVEQRLQPVRDRVAMHERNIEALRKEIANLR
jgi:Domain of unknown function (DUF4124)